MAETRMNDDPGRGGPGRGARRDDPGPAAARDVRCSVDAGQSVMTVRVVGQVDGRAARELARVLYEVFHKDVGMVLLDVSAACPAGPQAPVVLRQAGRQALRSMVHFAVVTGDSAGWSPPEPDPAVPLYRTVREAMGE